MWRRSGPSAGEVGAVRVDRGGAGHAVDDVLLSASEPGNRFRSAGRPAARWTCRALRRECERAKVALSAETAVDVDVEGVPVRMVRGDVEELSAPLVTRQLDTLGTVLGRSDGEGSPLRLILLLGGASATPSLVEAAGARFEVPVIAVPRVGEALARRTRDHRPPPTFRRRLRGGVCDDGSSWRGARAESDGGRRRVAGRGAGPRATPLGSDGAADRGHGASRPRRPVPGEPRTGADAARGRAVDAAPRPLGPGRRVAAPVPRSCDPGLAWRGSRFLGRPTWPWRPRC